MRLSRRLLIPPLAAALGLSGALGLVGATAAHAGTSTTVPNLTGFDQMALDSPDGYVFLSGSVGNTPAIAVTSLSGQYVTTLDLGDGPQGIALDGSTLYAALSSEDEIGVIDASGATPAQASTIALPPGDAPVSVAVQSGELWVSYAASGAGNDGIGEIDLSTGAFESVSAGWLDAPQLAADPSDSGVVVAVSQTQAATFSTTGSSPTQTATSAGLANGCTNLRQLAVVPGGAQFLAACGFPYSVDALSTTSLTVVSSYPTGAYPEAVAVASDGTLAAAISTGIQVYRPDGTEINVLRPSPGVAYGGLALSADGSELYAVTGFGSGPYDLDVFGSPEVTGSTVTLNGSSSVLAGTPVTLTGKLALAAGAPQAGTPITITRTLTNGTPVTLPATATTDATGDFSVTDTPPGAGTYTYTASYAGSAAIAPATSEFTTIVTLVSATLSLQPASAAVIAGSPVTLTGTLSYRAGAPAQGTPVSVSRLNPNGTTTPISGVTTSDASGDFTVTDDTATATGSYTYTASVGATQTTTSAQATATVSVALNPATLSLSGPASEAPGKAFSIAGKLSLGSGPPATGTPVTVSRKNPNGSSTPISVKTGTSGSFSISQDLSTLGNYTYTASVPATSTTTAATTTYKVTVAKATPTLTLSTGASTAIYQSTIHVTTHLGSAGTNRTVSIYAQLVGTGTRKLLKTARVNGSGNLTISYPDATRNVIFTTTFSGDAQYNARSASKRVGVDARVSMASSGWYTAAKYDGATFRVFHHTGHLNVTVTVTPNKRGEHLNIVIEQLYDGSWSFFTPQTTSHTLNSASKLSGYVTLTQATGGYFRLRAVFVPTSKDVTNVSYYSGWFYFHVVK